MNNTKIVATSIRQYHCMQLVSIPLPIDPAAIRRCDVPVESPSLAVCEFGFGAMFEAVKGGALSMPVGFCFTTCCPVAVG